MNIKKLYMGMDIGKTKCKIAFTLDKEVNKNENESKEKITIESERKLPESVKKLLAKDFVDVEDISVSDIVNKNDDEKNNLSDSGGDREDVLKKDVNVWKAEFASFLRKIIQETIKKTGVESVKKIAISLPADDLQVFDIVYEALKKLGIDRNKAMVTGRSRAFSSFILNQRRELWLNKVGLIDFSEDSLIYYLMRIDRMKTPAIIQISGKNCHEYMQMILDEKNDSDAKNKAFENMVKISTHSEVITSLFMTGDAFLENPLQDAMKHLSVGRHLFMDKDIFASGACYLAKSMDNNVSKYVFIDDETVVCDVIMSVYTDAKVRDVLLIKAGIPWYQAEEEFNIIPDNDDEICLICKNIVNGEKTRHMIPLYGIADRQRKKVRLNVKLRFLNRNKCIVTVRDKGFGNVKPCEYRIWEESILLGNK